MSTFDQLGKQIGEIDEVMNLWIKKLGANYAHFAVLYSLISAENGQRTQKAICDEWLMPKQTVFNVCKAYKEQGWIVFHESATDKRERIMSLTDLGKAQAEPLWQATQAMSEQVFEKFGEKKTAQLFALLSEFSLICRQQMNE